jgi:hypothetical protein
MRSTVAAGGVLTLPDAGGGVTRPRGVPCVPSGVAGSAVLLAGDAGTGGVARGITGVPSRAMDGVLVTAGGVGGIRWVRGTGGGTGGLMTTSAGRPTVAGSRTPATGTRGD